MWLPAVLSLALALPGAQDGAADDKGFRRREAQGPALKRVALVSGNAAYAHRPLRNPQRDAKAMAASLSELGLSVDARFDLDREGMLRALRDFGDRLDEDTVALFYYSGHGISHDGRSDMLPTEFRITTDTNIDLEAADRRRVTARLEEARSRLNIMCSMPAATIRSTPQASRAAPAGWRSSLRRAAPSSPTRPPPAAPPPTVAAP